MANTILLLQMKMTNETVEKIIPRQKKGSETGAKAIAELTNKAEAMALFKLAKSRLLDINSWDELCGLASATFELTDKAGNKISGPPEIGNLIRIDLPGPGTISGEGYDWVRIEAMEDNSDPENDEESFAFRARPVKSPVSDDDAPSHFYTDDATSSFIIVRRGTKIIASEQGRNEKPNTDTDKIVDKVRNAVVATGAKNGLAYPQWKALMEGLLKREV